LTSSCPEGASFSQPSLRKSVVPYYSGHHAVSDLRMLEIDIGRRSGTVSRSSAAASGPAGAGGAAHFGL
jgi:hypothetical protein